MKIGLVSPDTFYFPGGIQEHIKGLYRFLNSKGHKAKILAPRYNEEENYGKDVILFGNSIPFPWNGSSGTISFSFNIWQIKEVLEKEEFDILHFHNFGIFNDLEILFLSNSTNVATIHRMPDFSLFYKFTNPFFKLIIKKFSNKVEGAILVSKAQLTYFNFLKNYLNNGLEIVPNGVDTERFRPDNRKIKKFLDGKKNILFVGRMDKRKGLPYLIDAFEMVKRKTDDVRLIAVGDGVYRKKWERIVEKKNLKDVVFVGSQNEKHIPQYYATADVFCSSAVKGESFGIVLLEAMASGKPVVSFANRGYREVLKNYDRRFLVEPRNTRALAKALLTLVKDAKLRERLGIWGLRESRKYSWDIVGEKVLDFYERVQSNSS
ncbi:glycosyltransferase family 4 protein [archaeon]|nr:glycosyltransferase family 4 protein [archaeon]